MKFSLLSKLILEEAPQPQNLLPIEEYIDYAKPRGELIINDPRYDYIVVEPKTLASSCYYVSRKTKIPFCIADESDPESFNMLKMYGMTPYYFLSKNISIKNRNARSIFAIISGQRIPDHVDPKSLADRFTAGTKSQMISSAMKRNPELSRQEAEDKVNSEYHYTNPDGSYTDSFLKWVDDSIKHSKFKNGNLLQIFDSQNKLVSPYDFKAALEVPFKIGGKPRNEGLYSEFMNIID